MALSPPAAAKPAGPLGLYGGIFGNDRYGAGDIVPSKVSTPPGSDNTVDMNTGKQNAVTFKTPLSVPLN